MSLKSTDRRLVVRTKVDASGHILQDDCSSPTACDVLDLTNEGARLEVGKTAGDTGPEFDFSFDRFRTIRRCRLIWRAASFVGVKFLAK